MTADCMPAMTISARLKEATAALHTRAERHPAQAALLAGRMSLMDYGRLLGQLLLIHRTLEGHLEGLRRHRPAWAALLEDDRFRAARLSADLRRFGFHAADVTPCAPVAELIGALDRAADGDPEFLLGVHYVLEGSTNGGQFIARRLREVFDLEGAVGCSYFNPHGAAQRERWTAFRSGLDGLTLHAGDADRIEGGARYMFERFIAMFDHLRAGAESAETMPEHAAQST